MPADRLVVRSVEEEAGRDPRCHLAALSGSREVGRLKGAFRGNDLYRIRALHVAESQDREQVAVALVSFLRPSLSAEAVEVLLWDNRRADPTHFETLSTALLSAGYQVSRRKSFVERALVGVPLPVPGAFTTRTLAEMGQEPFMTLMTQAAIGDPFEDVAEQDPEREFQALIDFAGKRFDPADWMAVELDGACVGIVLPQIYEGSPEEGTLFYLGLLPSHRGRGLGRGLHAFGLQQLASRGAKRYLGSTDLRNAPMRRIFEANGCTETGMQVFYTPSGSD